jgi:hypothetical protein
MITIKTSAILILLAGLWTTPAYSQSGAGNDPATLVGVWKQENEKCRGGAGDDPKTNAACAARQNYGTQLRALGWCYEDQGAATLDWHPCATR